MTESDQFKNKVAVITGGTQGLGEAAARLYAERGMAGIIITGRNEKKAEKICKDIKAKGSDCFFIKAELSKVDECKSIIDYADNKFGKIDILVNCAGFTERGTILSTTPEHFDKMININLRAPFFLIQSSVKLMRREKVEGSIVSISSMQAHGGLPMHCPYSASKGALVILTKNIANSLYRDRIRVNAINIGWTDTPGETKIQKKFHQANDNWLKDAEKNMPFGRLIKVDEVAKAIAYLTSKESGLMTGSIIDFDQAVDGTNSQYYSTPRLTDDLLGI